MGVALTDKQDSSLDSLLCEWHQWQKCARVGRSFNNRALVCGEYRTSRQYDDANGALDHALDVSRWKQVDFEVSEMVDPYRAAIYVLARQLTVGVMVFSSPRLPRDPDESRAVVRTARGQLAARLVSAGVI